MYATEQLKEIDKALDHRKDLDVPQAELDPMLEGLNAESTEALERMLCEPQMAEPEFQELRTQILDIIGGRKGTDYISDLVQTARVNEDAAALLTTISDDQDHSNEAEGTTAGQRAVKALRKQDCPLCEVIPEDSVIAFFMDQHGYFYLELQNHAEIQMEDFDLMLDVYISGWLEEPGVCRDLYGVWAAVPVAGRKMRVDFVEIVNEDGLCTVKTNHPLARYISAPPKELFHASV